MTELNTIQYNSVTLAIVVGIAVYMNCSFSSPAFLFPFFGLPKPEDQFIALTLVEKVTDLSSGAFTNDKIGLK